MLLNKNFLVRPKISKEEVILTFLEKDSVEQHLDMSFEDFEYFYERLRHDFNAFKAKIRGELK